jgi:hypothetical protein
MRRRNIWRKELRLMASIRPLFKKAILASAGFAFLVGVATVVALRVDDGLELRCGPFWGDSGPRVTMTKPPMLAANKSIVLSYDASDCSGIQEIALRVIPRNPMPGASNAPLEIPLVVPGQRRVSRTDVHNLFSHPLWGQKVTLQLVATNGAGKKNVTEEFDMALPERQFFHPVARVLIQEREKLMQNPDDGVLREEAANIMASIAHQPASYYGDPVVLMALRGAAVRLILQRDREAAMSVNDILWRAATRIEAGNRAAS